MALPPNLVLAPEYRFLGIDKSSNGLGSMSVHWVGARLRFQFRAGVLRQDRRR